MEQILRDIEEGNRFIAVERINLLSLTLSKMEGVASRENRRLLIRLKRRLLV